MARKAPWPDFSGNPIYEGDTIIHPSGEKGIVIALHQQTCDSDTWRVRYGDGIVARLCLQVGDKGQAVVKASN